MNDAGLAQLVEQRIRNAWVGGSIPLTGTIEKELPVRGLFFMVRERPESNPRGLEDKINRCFG